MSEVAALEEDAKVILESMVPWELVAEFWTLSEALTARLVSTAWLEAIENLSPTICARVLSEKLQRNNIFLFHDTSRWKDAGNDDWRVTETLFPTTTTTTTSTMTTSVSNFSSILHCFRVCKYFPNEVVVAFNGKYGRHLLPTHLNDQSGSDAILYEKCYGSECTTCRFRIPLASTRSVADEDLTDRRRSNTRRRRIDDESSDDGGGDDLDDDHQSSHIMDIDSHFTIEDEKDRRLDLKQYYHSCVPNLPPGLTCPVCRCSDERTLLLSEFSYPSVPGGEARHPCHMRLTFTPDDDDVDDETGLDEDGAVQQQLRKRKRGENNINIKDPFPPPMYQDMGIPIETRPLLFKQDAKHVLSLHCVKCQRFGMLAPAAPCMHSQFPCQKRGVLEMIGPTLRRTYPTKLGGCFVRTTCSAADCYKPTLCQECARLTFHRTFERNDAVRWTSHCIRCRTTFCADHAWQSTCCCHI